MGIYTNDNNTNSSYNFTHLATIAIILFKCALALFILRNSPKERELVQSRLIGSFQNEVNFESFDELIYDPSAWKHVLYRAAEPTVEFLHPDALFAEPTTLLYYRGMAIVRQSR